MALSKTEEQLLKHLWAAEPCYLRDLLEALPEPKPARTTVATLLKRMIDKGVVGYTQRGNNREYHSNISKQAYFGRHVRGIVADFFSDSPADLASLFTDGAELSQEQLEALRRIVDNRLNDPET